MKQYSINAFKTESASVLLDIRRAELKGQHWNRAKSQHRADSEGIQLSNEHWAVLSNLRKRYLNTGLPRHARYLSEALVNDYTAKGGMKYLRHLFPGGPITQGSRFANLPTPPDATNASHGSCY